jgi:hypothetical protein
MHDANGVLTTQGWLFFSVCGVVLLAMGCTLLAYLLVLSTAEDRYAMDRADALSAQRVDDPERNDDAVALGLVSQVRLELARDCDRRATSSLGRRAAEIREGRPFPPAA